MKANLSQIYEINLNVSEYHKAVNRIDIYFVQKALFIHLSLSWCLLHFPIYLPTYRSTDSQLWTVQETSWMV